MGPMGKRGIYAMPALLMPALSWSRCGSASSRRPRSAPAQSSMPCSSLACSTGISPGTALKKSVYTAGVATGVVLLLIMASTAAGWILTLEEVPERFLDWAKGNFNTQFSVILLMNFMMLVAGMFIDLPAAILLLAPLFIPLATSYGIDLVQLGVVMVVNLAIGLYTPPVGTTFSSAACCPDRASVRPKDCCRSTWSVWWCSR